MSNHTQANASSKPPGVGTRIKGVFETAHGIGENIRGRTLGVIDDLSSSGSPESTSRYASIADRGRMETERGMARIYGYPDPNAANAIRNEHSHLPQPTTGTLGKGHTTGTGPGRDYVHNGKDDYYGRGGGVDGGVRRGAGGYGADDGYGQPGVQTVERQPPAIDRNAVTGPDRPEIDERGRLSPNRGPQNVGSEAGRSSMPQASAFTPTHRVDDGYGQPGVQNVERQQPTIDRNAVTGPDRPEIDERDRLSPNRSPQNVGSERIKRDFPPELPSRPQAQAAGDDQQGQVYQ